MASFLIRWHLPAMVQLFFPFMLAPSHSGDVTIHPPMAHPFFVSVTEFNHNAKDRMVEISCKLFAEDFERALKTQYKTVIDITHPKDPKLVDKYVAGYFQKHLQLKINDKSVQLQFVGYEKEEEAVWTYLQVTEVPAVKKLGVMNNILYELFNTEISIMHASVGGSRKSTRLMFPDTQATFDW